MVSPYIFLLNETLDCYSYLGFDLLFEEFLAEYSGQMDYGQGQCFQDLSED